MNGERIGHGFYRGWWIAAGCFVLAFFAWGIGFYGHGFYIVALGRSTGWPTTLLSSAVAAYWLANVASNLILGRVIDRFGSRPAIVYGMFVMAGGCFGMAAFDAGLLNARWQLFAVFAVMGSGYPGLATMAISASLIPWFKKRLGFALGLGLTGASAGGAIMPPVMAYLSGSYGFAATMTAVGILLIVSALPVVAFVIRGPKAGEAGRELGVIVSAARLERPPLGRFLADQRFWFITVACSLSLGAQVGFLMHQIPLLQGVLGLSGAALAVSIAAFSGAVGRLALGLLSGRLPLPLLAAGSYVTQALGMVILLSTEAVPLLYLASAIAGFVIGAITMLPPLLLVESIGSSGYGTAYGLTAAIMFVMASLATAASGWLYDFTGAYRLSLLILLSSHVAASILILWHGQRPRAAR